MTQTCLLLYVNMQKKVPYEGMKCNRAVHIANFCIARYIRDAELVSRAHRQYTSRIATSLDRKCDQIASNSGRFGRYVP